jgi:hypothetical protein
MSPEDKKKLNDLEQRLIAIETARNISFIKEIEKRLNIERLGIVTGASSSGTEIAVRNSSDTGSETVADDYVGVLTLYKNGVAIGRIGYYS